MPVYHGGKSFMICALA